MSEYVLDDLRFNPEPLTLYKPDGKDSVSKEELNLDREKNLEILRRVEHIYEERTGKKL